VVERLESVITRVAWPDGTRPQDDVVKAKFAA